MKQRKTDAFLNYKKIWVAFKIDPIFDFLNFLFFVFRYEILRNFDFCVFASNFVQICFLFEWMGVCVFMDFTMIYECFEKIFKPILLKNNFWSLAIKNFENFNEILVLNEFFTLLTGKKLLKLYVVNSNLIRPCRV